MSVREKAGLGSPPSSFYNNRSESINKLLKKHVQHQKSSLPEFVRQLYRFIQDQDTNMKKACVRVGDWHVDDSVACVTSDSFNVMSCHERESSLSASIQDAQQDHTQASQLSCSYDSIVDLSGIDRSILESMWKKAAEIVHSEGYITTIPGDSGGTGRVVAGFSTSVPHIVTPGWKSTSTFCCDAKCTRYAAYRFCSHTLAVAEVNGCLPNYLEDIKGLNIKLTCRL